MVVCSSYAGCRAFEVDSLDSASNMGAFRDKIAKVFPGNLALDPSLASLFALGAQLLHRALQANSQLVGRVTKNFSDRRRHSLAIGMDIVDALQLACNLGRQAMGKRLGNLGENVCDGGDG